MRLCYILLSPTFGMHQYTAGLARQMLSAGHEIALITTSKLPEGRYAPQVRIESPISASNTGFSREGLNFWQQDLIIKAVQDIEPDVIHFTGPHLWNITLVRRLRRQGYPVIHTIHDLVPHHGMRLGSLLGLWNRFIIREADQILVHGQMYREMLLQRGVPREKITFTPLLHLFVGYEQERALEAGEWAAEPLSYEPFALFFGRFEKYKGIEALLAAFAQMGSADAGEFKLVLAGPGDLSSFWTGELPANTLVYNQLIGDEQAVDLFKRCSLLLLPYTDATQSALVAAAYFFSKPVLVTRSGALAEYVVEGETGFVVEAGHPPSLARRLLDISRSQEQLRLMGEKGRVWYEQQRAEELATLHVLYTRYE